MKGLLRIGCGRDEGGADIEGITSRSAGARVVYAGSECEQQKRTQPSHLLLKLDERDRACLFPQTYVQAVTQLVDSR